MNHDEAVQMEATEQYLLDELSDDTREAFEEHYFDCPICAEDVKAAFAMHDAVRASQKKPDEFTARRTARASQRFVAPLAAAAAVAVAMFSWMQVGVVAPMRAALAEARAPFVPKTVPIETLRGSRIDVDNSTSGVELDVDIPVDAGQAPFTCRIIDSRNQPHGAAFTTSATSQKISIPRHGLEPGDYTIRVSDANQKVVTEYPIAVR